MQPSLIPIQDDKILIKGSFSAPQRAQLRTAGAVLLDLASVPLWAGVEATETGATLAFVAATMNIISFALPAQEVMYLDLAARKILTLKYYAFIRTSSQERPLSDFARIVLRHVCHSGGEGPDTFTGSVGMKPADGSAVLWIKEFPATQDEFPAAAHAFAEELQKLIQLPFVTP